MAPWASVLCCHRFHVGDLHIFRHKDTWVPSEYVERLRRILLLYLLLAAIYRLRHHLLVHGIVVLGLLIVLIRCIGSNLYQPWLRL